MWWLTEQVSIHLQWYGTTCFESEQERTNITLNWLMNRNKQWIIETKQLGSQLPLSCSLVFQNSDRSFSLILENVYPNVFFFLSYRIVRNRLFWNIIVRIIKFYHRKLLLTYVHLIRKLTMSYALTIKMNEMKRQQTFIVTHIFVWQKWQRKVNISGNPDTHTHTHTYTNVDNMRLHL